MQKFTLCLKKGVLPLIGLALLLFCAFAPINDSKSFIQGYLSEHYDKVGQGPNVKHYELNVTNNGFCKYRKVYNNGKEEFFAFNLTRFKRMDYYGNTKGGLLLLHTKSDDVIVQTRNDKQGAVDSMATFLSIPIKEIDVDELNELKVHFSKMSLPQLATNN